MLVRVSFRLTMRMQLGADFHGDRYQTAVLNTALRDHLLGKPRNCPSLSFEHGHFHAARMVEVHVQG